MVTRDERVRKRSLISRRTRVGGPYPHSLLLGVAASYSPEDEALIERLDQFHPLWQWRPQDYESRSL